MRHNERYDSTSLFTVTVYISLYTGTVHVLSRVAGIHLLGYHRLRMLAGVHRAPPELWPRLEGEEVRGPTSLAVPVGGMGTASVAPVKAPPVPGMQKPPCQVGKRFPDRLVAAP
jgi:hypothetical protein